MKSFSMQNYKHYFNIYSYTHKKVGEVSRGHKGKKGNWMKKNVFQRAPSKSEKATHRMGEKYFQIIYW